MYISELHSDDSRGGGPSITDPTWLDVETAIRSLDGKRFTMVGLVRGEEGHMTIGGGPTVFVCSVWQPTRLRTLFDPSKSSNAHIWLVVGQGMEIPDDECISIETALQAARMYTENGSCDQTYSWKELKFPSN